MILGLLRTEVNDDHAVGMDVAIMYVSIFSGIKSGRSRTQLEVVAWVWSRTLTWVLAEPSSRRGTSGRESSYEGCWCRSDVSK